MSKQIDTLRGHVIVCGAGRVGREVARELYERGNPFVIIDSSPTVLADCTAREWLTVEGDASSDEVLRRAGVDRAGGLIVATQSDAENTFIILSAKGLRPALSVIARVTDPQSESKLFQAGADRVISPTTIAGRRMAIATLHPSVVDFAETVLRGGPDKPILAEIDIGRGAAWDGVSIAEAFAGRSVRVLGSRSPGANLQVAPPGDFCLGEGIALMVYGSPSEIEDLSVFAAPG